MGVGILKSKRRRNYLRKNKRRNIRLLSLEETLFEAGCDCCPGSVNLFNIKFYIVISRIVFVFVQNFSTMSSVTAGMFFIYCIWLVFIFFPLNQDQNIYRAYDREMFFIGKLLFSEPTRRLMILYEKKDIICRIICCISYHILVLDQ